MAVPEILVRKLYVPGSFAELEDGFAFVLRNTFAPATVQSFAIEVDGSPVPAGAVALTLAAGLPMTSQMLSEAGPLTLRCGCGPAGAGPRGRPPAARRAPSRHDTRGG